MAGRFMKNWPLFFEEIIYEFTGRKVQAFDQMERIGSEKKGYGSF